MKRHTLVLTLCAVAACGTIMNGARQDIGISSSPTGASVMVDNQAAGQTPYVAKLTRKDHHVVKISAPGYAPAELTLTRRVSGWVWGNLVLGGLIGLAVDAISGGLYKLTPDQLNTTLAAQTSQIAPTEDGLYVVLVEEVDPTWMKIGQLHRAGSQLPGE